MRSKLSCKHCGRESVRDEEFLDVSLSLDVKVNGRSRTNSDLPLSIIDCLKHFTTIEQLTEEVVRSSKLY